MSTINRDYLIDVFYLRDFLRQDPNLKGIFADSEVIKIFHGCDSDIKYLISDLGIMTVNIFDTGRFYSMV